MERLALRCAPSPSPSYFFIWKVKKKKKIKKRRRRYNWLKEDVWDKALREEGAVQHPGPWWERLFTAPEKASSSIYFNGSNWNHSRHWPLSRIRHWEMVLHLEHHRLAPRHRQTERSASLKAWPESKAFNLTYGIGIPSISILGHSP